MALVCLEIDPNRCTFVGDRKQMGHVLGPVTSRIQRSRSIGCIASHALLLSTHVDDPRGPDREVAQVQFAGKEGWYVKERRMNAWRR